MKKTNYYLMSLILVAGTLCGCSEDEPAPGPENPEQETSLPDWYYAGGELGTAFLSTSNAYEQPTPVVEADAEMNERFKHGEALFEKMYMTTGLRTR